MIETKFTAKFGNRTFDDVGEGIEFFVSELQRVWKGQAVVASKVLKDYLDQVAQEMARRHGGSETGPNALARRTGRSVNSIIRSVKVTGKTWETLTGSIGGAGSLAIHEYGGTIYARSAKYLTIPLPAAKASTGNAPPFARQWRNTFVAMSKNGNLIIFQKRVSGIVPLYVLKPSVRIRPRLGMRQEIKDRVPYFLSQAADLVVRDVESQLGAV